MAHYDNIYYSHSVVRVIPGRVRVIQLMLYAAVAFFALVGLWGGLLWGIMATATLVFTWYYMGLARVSFVYELSGARLKVQRTSGFKSRPKVENFAEFDMTRLCVLAPEGAAQLDETERETKEAQPRRITYDLSAHDKNQPCAVMYLQGVGEDNGHWVKAYIQPTPQLLNYFRQIAPGRVCGFD